MHSFSYRIQRDLYKVYLDKLRDKNDEKVSHAKILEYIKQTSGIIGNPVELIIV